MCLIRAGMVLTVTDIWKTFIVERDLRGNIATTMEEAKQRFSNKSKVTKRTNTKATVANTQSTNAGKPLVAIIKTATGLSKKFKISFKSKTTEKMNDDESLCKYTQSAELTSINLSAISAISSSDIYNVRQEAQI